MWDTNDFVIKGDWSEYLSLAQEKLLVVRRKHRFQLVVSLIFIALLSPLFIVGSFFLGKFIGSFSFSVIASLVVIMFSVTLVLHTVIEWYFHLYIVTNKKILEVSYAPLSSRVINSVLLDQVRCTEIDIQTNGILNYIIDMGDVNITFDRPTRQGQYLLANVKNPRKVGAYLSNTLVGGNYTDDKSVWTKIQGSNRHRFFEEIYPSAGVSG